MRDRLLDVIARAAAIPVGPGMRILPGICASTAKVHGGVTVFNAAQEPQEKRGAVARITCPCPHKAVGADRAPG